jgi:hypothetical protein
LAIVEYMIFYFSFEVAKDEVFSLIEFDKEGELFRLFQSDLADN